MSITELDLYCRDIEKAQSNTELTSLRVIFQRLMEQGEISLGLYDGLKRDIRSRADWLQRRK